MSKHPRRSVAKRDYVRFSNFMSIFTFNKNKLRRRDISIWYVRCCIYFIYLHMLTLIFKTTKFPKPKMMLVHVIRILSANKVPRCCRNQNTTFRFRCNLKKNSVQFLKYQYLFPLIYQMMYLDMYIKSLAIFKIYISIFRKYLWIRQ